MSIEEIFGKESDKIAHVVGHGPSLSNHLNTLSNLDKSKNILISLNDIDKMVDLIPDYWITTNPHYTIENFHNRINKYENTTYIYSDVMDLTPPERVKELLKVKYYSFDNVHFKSQPNIFYVKDCRLGCQRGWIDCCSRIIPGRLTIQEHLQRFSNFEHHFSTTDTTILSTLAMAVLLNPKEINLYGVDLDYKLGYVNNYTTNSDSFDFWMDRILSDFYIINESANKIGIKINYFGFNVSLDKIINERLRPDKVYPSDCKNY
jgi:hypothetical protein